jgi:hypothetical protein
MGFVTVVLLCLLPALGLVLTVFVAMDAYGRPGSSSHPRSGIRVLVRRVVRSVTGGA